MKHFGSALVLSLEHGNTAAGKCTYLCGKRNLSRVTASTGHMDWKCCVCSRARGSPVCSTANRLVTPSFHVLGDGQLYFIDNGMCNACKHNIRIVYMTPTSGNLKKTERSNGFWHRKRLLVSIYKILEIRDAF